MTIYISHLAGSYPRVPNARLFADTLDELQAAAKEAGISSDRFDQDHYLLDPHDLGRFLAQRDVVKPTVAQANVMLRRLRETGSPGTPEEAYRWGQDHPSTEVPEQRRPGGATRGLSAEVQRQREIDMAYRQRDLQQRAEKEAEAAAAGSVSS